MTTMHENTGTQISCPQCNSLIKTGLKFCPACGASLIGEADSTARFGTNGAKPVAPTANPSVGNKGKLKWIIIAAVIVVIFVFISKLNSPISQVKHGTLENFGSQTIGEMVEDNFKKIKWDYEKLDGNSGFVSVEGYCVTFQETMCLEFYYEKDSDQFLLKEIEWIDSGEVDTNLFSMALTLGMLYN